jgi:hypothetical protein
MTAHSKYYVLEAATLDARRRHRTLIELALKNRNLPPELRITLETELQQALIKEWAAQKAMEEEGEKIEEEEEKKKKTEGDSEGGGDQQGGTGKSGSGDSGGPARENESAEKEDEGLSDLEIFMLLLFLAEGGVEQPQASDPGIYEGSADLALAAATLLFDREEKIAHIHEPYMAAQDSGAPVHSEFLPSLEHHATNMGAQVMCLKVHLASVDFFRNKLGYKPHGQSFRQGNVPMQRMRKILIQSPKLQCSNCV